MSYYKILVQPAKSSQGTCKVCNRNIEKDSLRIRVADDREFKEYIRSHGGRSQFFGEGMSRGGYIQSENGTVSIKRYFVHLDCYTPIIPHPFYVERFRCEKFNARHKAAFQSWLEQKQKEPVKVIPAEPPKKKRSSKKSQDDDEVYGNRKTKKINKLNR